MYDFLDARKVPPKFATALLNDQLKTGYSKSFRKLVSKVNDELNFRLQKCIRLEFKKNLK